MSRACCSVVLVVLLMVEYLLMRRIFVLIHLQEDLY
jgi:hypothetical protein